MTDTGRNFLVGLFVVASLVVLATLMAWFGEVPDWLGGNEWTMRITGVRELRGVNPGSAVQLNGVAIGRVKALEFADTSRPDHGVVIVTRIKEAYTIPRGAKARVFGSTFGLGSGQIDIVVDPTQEFLPLPKHDAQIPGEMRSIIGEFITKDMVDSVQRTITNFGNFADAATPVAQNLSKLLEQRTVAAVSQPEAEAKGISPNVSTVIERIDDLVANLNAVLGDVNVQGDVKAVVGAVKTAADDLKTTIEIWKSSSRSITDNLNSGIDRIEENLDRSFANVNDVLDTLDDGSKSLAAVLRQVAQGRGTAGLVVRDERLYEAAVLSLERFADAMARLQAILSKIETDGYITVGQAPSGLLHKKFPIAVQATQNP